MRIRGREATLPSDLAFAPDEDYKSEDDNYVEKMMNRLRQAFELARERQYRAFVDNRNKKAERQKPTYEKGDLVMVYSKTAKEARLEIAGDKRSVPTKWRNPWIGPALFDEEVSNTSCKVYYEGKEMIVNYNRIGKFTPWDEIIESSDEWKDRIEGRKTAKRQLKESEKTQVANDRQGDRVLVGDVFLFEMDGKRDNYQNFGVDMALNITDTHIHFQWMGNYYDAHSISGSFKLGWIDTTKNCEYYRNSRETKRHEPFTGQMSSTVVTKECVLLAGRDNILTKDNRLTAHALKTLRC